MRRFGIVIRPVVIFLCWVGRFGLQNENSASFKIIVRFVKNYTHTIYRIPASRQSSTHSKTTLPFGFCIAFSYRVSELVPRENSLTAQPQQPFFSALSPDLLVTLRLVNSSETVGWMPTVRSSIYLVRPMRMATAYPCIT